MSTSEEKLITIFATKASEQEASQSAPVRYRIEPSRGWMPLRFSELWEYRELLYFLTWQNVLVRYKQTALGVAWAVIQPLATMVVFSLFFHKLAGIQHELRRLAFWRVEFWSPPLDGSQSAAGLGAQFHAHGLLSSEMSSLQIELAGLSRNFAVRASTCGNACSGPNSKRISTQRP